MNHRPLLLLMLCAVLFAAGGASCPRMLQQYTAPAPIVFQGTPSTQQVIAVVNANSEEVRQLQSTGATLSAPGIPTLRASLTYEQPNRFRLIADTSLTGVELDLGSNDELFWMWVKRNDPPAVYFCRHDEFRQSAVRQTLPIEPTWLAEALGVVKFDPTAHHEGPFPAGDGKIEMRSTLNTADGPITKVTVLHAAHGWVLEQHIVDGAGRRIASAVASRHRYDSGAGVTLPRHVEVQLPTIEMQFSLDISDYIVNHIAGDPQTLWAMPERTNAEPVNLGALADANSRLQPPQWNEPPAAAYDPYQAQPVPPAAAAREPIYFTPQPARRSGYERRP
ncbi:MAG: hypothetical protein KDA41_03075 [Planctomycetales bacterium]|nr:hypothetical protein [Planctomycetales bacterium]